MTNPLAREALRLPVELLVAVVAGTLLAAIVISLFVLAGTACPGARHSIGHVVSQGCEP